MADFCDKSSTQDAQRAPAGTVRTDTKAGTALTRAPELLALAQRCEEAMGPSRRLDGEIYCALSGLHFIRVEAIPAVLGTFLTFRAPGQDEEDDVDNWPAYTASLDAALGLVPEGLLVSMIRWLGEAVVSIRTGSMVDPETVEWSARAKTLPLATSAAALRALAALDRPA